MVNDITKPKTERGWELEEDGKGIKSEEEIADIFNEYFMDKIEKLKENIDHKYVKEPLEKLKKKMENRNLKFALKTVTEKKVLKAMRSMKKRRVPERTA